MRITGLIILFVLTINNLFAQNKSLKESYVDSISYVYALNGKHNELVKIANQAFDAKIDYYYLRYRLGVSYFNKKKYLFAAENFSKALEFYPADFYTKEYLFYCYLYLNNIDEAKNISLKLPSTVRTSYEKLLGKERLINIESGYQTTSYNSNQDTSNFLGTDGVYAESDRMKSLQYYQVGINFPVTKKIKLYTGFSYVNNNRTRHIYSNDNYYYYDYNNLIFNKINRTKDTAQEYSLNQYQAYLGTSISLPKKFTLQVGFQNMYYSQNKLTASSDSLKSTLLDTLIYNYKYQLTKSTQNNFVTSISLSKMISNWNLQTSVGLANIDKTNIFQVGAQTTYSPLGNYNLNITGGYYCSFDSTVRNILFAKISGRITDSWWYEAYHYQGNLKNYHESNAYVVYNISDIIKSKSGVNIAYYFHPNWTLNMRYDFLVRTASYTRYIVGKQNVLSENYFNNSFIVNLVWKF